MQTRPLQQKNECDNFFISFFLNLLKQKPIHAHSLGVNSCTFCKYLFIYERMKDRKRARERERKSKKIDQTSNCLIKC